MTVRGSLKCIEVIKALIDHLALGLQKWVGWADEGNWKDTCCLMGIKNVAKGIGNGCDHCPKSGGQTGMTCCCHGCDCKCGTGQCCRSNSGCDSGTCTCCYCKPDKCHCYRSAYSKTTALWTDVVNGKPGTTNNNDPFKVHLLARIFLGSVCLIWSGLSQLGFLTGGSGGTERWKVEVLSNVEKGLGSFMAAMGYDLERLNQGQGEYFLG